MNTQPLIDQLDQLLASFETLQKRAKYDDMSDLPKESTILAARFQAAFDRLTVPGDSFRQAADAERNHPSHVKLFQLAYLAYALRDEMKDGWAERIAELVHADTSAGMLEMSADLLSAGYKDAAAVIAGTALELHLRELATKHGLSATDAKGKAKKADLLRAELRQAQVLTALEDKRVLYWLGVRNDAAHGNYSGYSADDVKALTGELNGFIDRHPA